MRWTEEQTLNFVLEYINYECLYNVNCTEYRNKQKRDAAMLKISENINIKDFGLKEVYLKIRSLKSTYSQELKKVKSSQRSGAGTSDIYRPNIKWFNILHDALTAVNSTGECRETTSSFETASSPGEVQQEEESTSCSEVDSQTNERDSPQPHTGTNIKTKPRKRLIKEYDNLLTKVQKVANAVNKPVEQTENEFDVFGKSVSVQLKSMPLEMAIEAQMYIQNYLSEMRLRTIQRTIYHPQRPSSSHSNYIIPQPLSSPYNTQRSSSDFAIPQPSPQRSSSAHSNYIIPQPLSSPYNPQQSSPSYSDYTLQPSPQRSSSSNSNYTVPQLSPPPQTTRSTPPAATSTLSLNHPEESTEMTINDRVTLTYENPESSKNTTLTFDLLSQTWNSANETS